MGVVKNGEQGGRSCVLITKFKSDLGALMPEHPFLCTVLEIGDALFQSMFSWPSVHLPTVISHLAVSH